MSNVTRYLGEAHRGPSPRLWGDMSKIQQDAYQGKCGFFFDDFCGYAPHIASNTTAAVGASGIKYYTDDGVVIAGRDAVADIGEELGVIEVSGNDADNDEGQIKWSDNWMRIDNGAGNTGKVIFEGRFKTASIADNGCSIFLGLTSWQPAANGLTDDTGAFTAAEAFIGFRTLAADGDILEFVFQAASQTVNTLFDAQTLVADTYYKVGFVYDPASVDRNKLIKVYVDNVEQGTYVTETNIDAATFPEGEALSPALLTKVGTAAEVKVTLDWVAAAQYCTQDE